MKLDSDVIVIGSGIAGITATIYLRRANLDVIVVEKEMPGGLLNKISNIENYPGFERINGTDLAMKLNNHMMNYEPRYEYGNLIEIIDHGSYKTVKTDVAVYNTRFVILAMGRVPKKLNIEGEAELENRGISWCATCDGFLYKGKDVAVIGGGNSALQETQYLTALASSVTLINRSENYRADASLVEEVKSDERIKVLENKKTVRFNAEDNKLSSITVRDVKTGVEEDVYVDGAFIYTGQTPVSESLESLNILDENRYVAVDENQQTKVENIYAAGDIVAKDLYQLVNASSEGAIAASEIIKKSHRKVIN